MLNEKGKLTVGTDAVVIGDISGNVGDGSVVIGATDSQGNVVLTQPMAVGRNAHAGPGSIAIGAGASAGSELASALIEIRGIVEASGDQQLKLNFADLYVEIGKTSKNPSRVAQLWGLVKSAGALNGAIGLVARVSALLAGIAV